MNHCAKIFLADHLAHFGTDVSQAVLIPTLLCFVEDTAPEKREISRGATPTFVTPCLNIIIIISMCPYLQS